MRFGVLTLPMVAWGDLVEQWRYLEELGFDAIYVADALAHPRDASQRWFDAWVCLATLGQVTDHPRIGPLVTSIIFRDPAAVVNAASPFTRYRTGGWSLRSGRVTQAPTTSCQRSPHGCRASDATVPRRRCV